MLDGVEIPFENLTTLNLSQVERIEVVQGAASASIYGAQGANGVIQIFTKRGSKGRLSVNVSSSYAANSFINSGDFGKAELHPYLTNSSGNIIYQGTNTGLGYTAGEPISVDPVLGIIVGSNSISYRYGANVISDDLPDPTIPGLTDNYTRYGILDPRNVSDQPYVGTLKYHNHFDEIFQKAGSFNNSVSVSGGSDKMDFNFAVSNNRTNSPFLEDNGYLGSSGLILAAGRKIGEIYGYKALTDLGQLRADGKTPFIDASEQGNYEIVNGRVVNKTTKAIFFSDEAESLGDPNPTLTSSFINTITWKNTVTFGFQVDWISGSHLYNQTNEWMYRDGISKDFAKPVTINGETGAYTAYYASAYYALGNTARGVGNNVTKDFFYEDASFVRLRNISLGVDFSTFAKQEWLKKCQLIFSGRNLFTLTDYSGMDPEISSGASNSSFDRGIDHSTIPNLKSYQVTLNLGF